MMKDVALHASTQVFRHAASQADLKAVAELKFATNFSVALDG
jgi:hypothetical protein